MFLIAAPFLRARKSGVQGAINHLGGMGLGDRQTAPALAHQVTNQAYLLASTDLFRLSSLAGFAPSCWSG